MRASKSLFQHVTLRRLIRLTLWVVSLASVALLLLRLYTIARYTPSIHAIADAPPMPVAIVFGAGLWRDGRPSPVLYDRVATAVDLYQDGKVQMLLMSGDGQTNREPIAMRKLAIELGVSEGAILLDNSGLRTYDSCHRAKSIFGIERALLVTQQFHLPRALLLCEAAGLSATGIRADRRPYNRISLVFTHLRETLATANAWWEVAIAKP
ncbi:MAG TPA: ElyC/SanA/YdcF family protein [Anaerolineales bacterium]|nr:ElyC/SanA/YdcF family protein [Anaerolineales bacterium]